MSDLMTTDEVLLHLSMGEGHKAMGSTYLMNPAQYQILKKSLEEHVASGTLVLNEFGTYSKATERSEE
jgi:hypothetical protein